MADPMAFAKQNWKPIAAAALPVLSNIGTTTPGQAPTPMSPGRIREKRWDGRQFVDVASTDAGVYNTSGRSYSDLYRGYNDGGIVALAEGGDVIRMADGTPPAMLSDEALYQKTGSWEAAAAARDAQNNALNAFNNQQAAAARDTAANAANLATWNTQAAARDTAANASNAATWAQNPDASNWWATQSGGVNALYDTINNQLNTTFKNATDAQIDAAMKQYGISNEDVAAALRKGGGSQAQEYAMLAGNMGLSGLNTNINDWITKANADPRFKALTPEQQRAEAVAAMGGNVNMNEADVKRATGKTIAELFPDKELVCGPGFKKSIDGKTCVPIGVTETFETSCPTGYHWDAATKACVKNVDATQNTTTNVASPTDLFTAPASSLAVGVSGNTGPSQIGGGATVNPNGTITTSPRIPGIPVGGFTGSKNLRDTYTKGGGSLGYTSPKFDSLDDFTEKYVNKRMSGDSLAAYNYLSGKGGAKYPVKSGVGQISEDYATAVLGYPARGNLPYIYNKATGKMDPNPDYVAPGRDDKGNVTYSMSTNDIKSALKDTPMSGQALYDWAMSNKLSAQQIADATGQSLSQVYAQFRAGSKAKAATDKKTADDKAVADAANNQLDSSSTGGEAAGGLQRSYAMGGYAVGGGLGSLGSYSDGGRLLKGPGDGVSDSIPATIGEKQQPARLADGEFVVPARIVSELGNGSTEAGAKKLYAMMDRVQRARGKTTGKNKVAANSRADKYLPA